MKEGSFLRSIISRHTRTHAVVGIILTLIFLLAAVIIPPSIAPEFTGSADLRVQFDAGDTVVVPEGAFSDFPYEIAYEKISDSEHRFVSRSLSNEEHRELLAHIDSTIGSYTVIHYESSSPSISQELVRKAIIALIAAAFIIICYIAFVFRGVSRPVASWKYGVVAVIALLHDIIAPVGVFVFLSWYTTASVDTLFVTALLAILGYSINDTIVVFDRIRDRLRMNAEKGNKEEFDAVIDYGVSHSMRRSLYTSLSTIIPLVFLFLLVPVTRWFGVALFVGVVAGTYSSLFFAPSLLLLWHRYFPQKDGQQRQKTETEKAEESLRKMLRNTGDTI